MHIYANGQLSFTPVNQLVSPSKEQSIHTMLCNLNNPLSETCWKWDWTYSINIINNPFWDSIQFFGEYLQMSSFQFYPSDAMFVTSL